MHRQVKIINSESERLRIFILLGIFCLGSFLRLSHLGDPPLWIDEALFASWIKSVPRQEIITQLLARFLPTDEFWLRLPVAVAGSITIPVFYWVTGRGFKSLYGAALLAVFPIFVFWSRLARPYAFAGLFIVLGWRWWGFYIPAILTTPMSIIGLNFLRMKEKRYRYYSAALILLSFAVYLVRPDVKKVGDLMEPGFLILQKRFWYVPILTLMLYCCTLVSDKYFTRHPGKKVRRT